MNTRWITRLFAGLALVAAGGLALPNVAGAASAPPATHAANFYFVDLPASGSLGPDPTAAFANIPPAWLGVTGFAWGPDQSPEKDRLGSLTVNGFDTATSQNLLVAVANKYVVHVIRVVVTQANASGQQVPAEIIVAKNALVTLPTGKGVNPALGPAFVFNYNDASYEYSVPDGAGGLKWIPDLTKPTMMTVRPIAG